MMERWVITNDVSDYINLLVRIAHIICNHLNIYIYIYVCVCVCVCVCDIVLLQNQWFCVMYSCHYVGVNYVRKYLY
jgi:hypothetical protein